MTVDSTVQRVDNPMLVWHARALPRCIVQTVCEPPSFEGATQPPRVVIRAERDHQAGYLLREHYTGPGIADMVRTRDFVES